MRSHRHAAAIPTMNPTPPGARTTGSKGPPALTDTVSRVQEIATIRSDDRVIGRFDRLSALVLGWAVVVGAVVLAVAGGWPSHAGARPWVWLGMIVLYAVAHDTVFASAAGSAVPTQPILVAMLMAMPLHLVPAALLVGVLAGSALSPRRGPVAYRIGVDALGAAHGFGPVAVLALAGDPGPALDHWPVYALALAAQFAVDGAVAVVRCMAIGTSLRGLVQPMLWTFGVDTMLAPIGLTAVLAAGDAWYVLLFLAAPLGLIRLLAADRSAQLEQVVTLGTAFAEIKSQARVDALTGIANRREWLDAVDGIEHGEGAAAGTSTVFLVADLDHLKRTNDTLGHQAGDDLLRRAAAILTSVAPPGALVARLGGDEFGVLMGAGDDGAAGAAALVTAVRAALDAQQDELPVSMSLGAAAVPPHPTPSDAFAAADDAALRDKVARRVGRDPAG